MNQLTEVERRYLNRRVEWETSRDELRLLAIFSSSRSLERVRMKNQISTAMTASPTIVTIVKLMLGLLGLCGRKKSYANPRQRSRGRIPICRRKPAMSILREGQ